MTDLVQHHKYSASGSSGWMHCAGKITMEQGIPDRSSSAADEGSAAHFLASHCLMTGKEPKEYLHHGIICWEKPGEFDGQMFFGEDLPEGAKERSTWKIDREMVDCIGDYCDYVRKLSKGGQLLVEQRVEFGKPIGLPGAFGTSDAIILSRDGAELIVVDLKYGYSEVSAKENPQMMLYALGALNAAPEKHEEFTNYLEDLV